MNQVAELSVYFTVLDDGSHLAASKTEPLFCVSGATREETEARVIEILRFHDELCAADDGRDAATSHWVKEAKRVIRPFAPSDVKRFKALECVP